MSCGGCKARGEALTRVAKTVVSGKTDKVAEELKFVVQSTVKDSGSVLRSQMAAARQRLTRR